MKHRQIRKDRDEMNTVIKEMTIIDMDNLSDSLEELESEMAEMKELLADTLEDFQYELDEFHRKLTRYRQNKIYRISEK